MERDVEEEVIEEYVEPYPVTVIFDSLDNRQVTVLNPISNKIADLDEALLEGVVRHPDSADFQSEGTIFLFGHSSYLPSVINKNFQAFNGIQKLQWGDTVRLQSLDREYVYRVDRVYQAKASDAEVEITRGEAKLTLATCNSFGSKDDRYIVEATLVDSYPLSV
jgi:LPXTG-site transpeptidase (sortase) family protein